MIMFDSLLFQFSFFLLHVFIVFVIFHFPFSSVHSCSSSLHLTDEDGVDCKDILGKSDVTSLKRTTSFVVWRESIYWMRLKAKRQSQS